MGDLFRDVKKLNKHLFALIKNLRLTHMVLHTLTDFF